MHRLQCSRLCILLICLSNGLGSVIAQFNNENIVERRACLIFDESWRETSKIMVAEREI